MLRYVIIMPIHVMQSVKFFTWTTYFFVYNNLVQLNRDWVDGVMR